MLYAIRRGDLRSFAPTMNSIEEERSYTERIWIKWRHETRDLPVPTSADCRQQKLSRVKAMLDDGVPIKDIAKKLGYSPRGLKLALEMDAAENGTGIADVSGVATPVLGTGPTVMAELVPTPRSNPHVT